MRKKNVIAKIFLAYFSRKLYGTFDARVRAITHNPTCIIFLRR
jgi:hypothetical protein